MAASHRLARARALTDRAEKLARPVARRWREPHRLVTVTGAWARMGDPRRAAAAAKAVAAQARADDPFHHIDLATAYAWIGSLDRVRRHLNSARELIPAIEADGIAMIAQGALAPVLTYLGDLGPAEEIARSLPDPSEQINTLLRLARCAQPDHPPSVVEPHDAARLTGEAARLARDTPSLNGPARVRMCIVHALLLQGRVAEARELAEEIALLLLDVDGSDHAYAAEMFSRFPDVERTLELAGRAEPLVAAETEFLTRVHAQAALVTAYTRAGDEDRARRLLSSIDDLFYRKCAAIGLAEALADGGDFGAAERILSTIGNPDSDNLGREIQADGYLRIVDRLLSPGPAAHEDTPAPMRRIAIFGCGGAGKSHLARRLAVRLGFPATHLDDHYYDDGWNPAPADEFAATQRDLVGADRWIIDGNYASTLPIRLARADTVILLDLPAHTCLWGIARRRGRHRITLPFLWYVIRYRRTMRPRVEALIAEHAGHARYLRFTSHRQVNRFLAAR